MKKQNRITNDEGLNVAPAGSNALVSGSRRHKWGKEIISEDGNYFICRNCGIKKKNIWMGYGKNGRAALYFLQNGERTSFRPDCR